MHMSVPPIRAAGLAAAVFFITAAAAATAPVQAGAGGPGTALMAQTGAGMALNPDHPERYVVKRGDTLWDISAMFLRDPWYWPEIWYVNPQVANPHLIYPGDVLTLVYVDGRPQIRLDRGTQAGGTERLSPRIREEDLDDAITTIPFETIGPFLSKGAVLSKDEIDQLPYVVAIRDKHLVASAGNDLYVRGNVGSIDSGYSVVHIGEKLVDPETNDVLGYEGIFVGEGTILRTGDPATLRLNKSTREALTGDRLIVQDFEIPLQFYPRVLSARARPSGAGPDHACRRWRHANRPVSGGDPESRGRSGAGRRPRTDDLATRRDRQGPFRKALHQRESHLA
jgi:hypothetical protein